MVGNWKVITVASIIVLISIWHYATAAHHTFLHIFHRELYLVPICLAAYWFGTRGGLLTAVISIIVFLPRTMAGGHGSGIYDLNNLLQIPTFLLIGYLVGTYQDVRRRQFATLWSQRPEEKRKESGTQSILVCIDNSENAGKAARYVAENMCWNDRMKITVMGFVREPSPEFFSKPEEHARSNKDAEENIVNLVEDSKRVLLENAFPPEAVRSQVVTLQKDSITTRILEEQKRSHYDTIVVGGTKMSKTEEFILGNKAVKLVREADCPVVTVF